jgi:hypothetical protein
LSALRALIRATDFFSQPDKDTQFPTDAGQSEIAVIQEDEKRMLKFSSRPELQPLLEILWKFVAEAEAWHELTADGDLSAITNLRDKTLQPARLKVPLQKYLLAQKDRRKIQQAADVLSTLTTPEEFVGFLTEMQASDPANRFLAFVRGDPKRVSALCPLYLQFAKENYPRQLQLSQSEKEMLDYAIGTLVDARYAPMIPLLLSWFDANTEPRVNAPWSRVSQFGVDATRALIPKLDSKEAVHRQNALELLTMNARLNPHNRYSNPISEQEYGSMKEIFAKTVLPKLWTMTRTDPSTEVRNNAYKAIKDIEDETKKVASPPPKPSPIPPKFLGPFVTLSVDADHNLNRTILDPEPGALNWVITRNGKVVLERNAKNETQFRYPEDTPGVYCVYVTGWIGGAYRVISNVVFYTTEKSPVASGR